MTVYSYSIIADTLNGKVAPFELSQEINASTITIALEKINTSGDDLNIEFKLAISASEKTTLDNIVATHQGVSNKPVSEVKVLEEDLDPLKRTGGNFRAKTVGFDIPASVSWHYMTFSFPYDIGMLSMEFIGTTNLVDDKFSIDVYPDTVIGTVTADITASDTVINVSSTVIDNVVIGYKLILDDGTNNEHTSYIVDIDKLAGTITLENGTTNAYLAATPTTVKHYVPAVEEMEIDYTTSATSVGSSKIGASFVPKNTPIRIGFYNHDGTSGKRFRAVLEFLY